MGSPLSFPLLCIINLSVYRKTVYDWFRDHPLCKDEKEILLSNVIINGDDIVFRAPRDFILKFYENIELVGFLPSKGKNFVSRRFAMINSRVYKAINIDHGPKDFLIGYHYHKSSMMRFGYLNLPLVQGKVLHGLNVPTTPDMIGRSLTEMMDLCPWTQSLLNESLKRWECLWKTPKNHFVPNYYLPSFLGGYGIDRSYAPFNWRITRSQRQVVNYILRDNKFALYQKLSTTSTTFTAKLLLDMCGGWKLIPKNKVTPEDLEREKLTEDFMIRAKMISRISQITNHDLDKVSGKEMRKIVKFSEGQKRLRTFDSKKVPEKIRNLRGLVKREKILLYADGISTIVRPIKLPPLPPMKITEQINYKRRLNEVEILKERSKLLKSKF
jgi:hypothetical protein